MKQLDTNINCFLLARVAFPNSAQNISLARRGKKRRAHQSRNSITGPTQSTQPIYNGGHHHLRDQARSKSPLALPGVPLAISPSHRHHLVPGQLDHRSANGHLCNHHPQSHRDTIRPSPSRLWSSSIAAISHRTFRNQRPANYAYIQQSVLPMFTDNTTLCGEERDKRDPG